MIKQDLHEPSLSLALMDTFKSHEPVTQEEVDYEHGDDEVIEFDDEFNSKLEIELGIDLLHKKLSMSTLFG